MQLNKALKELLIVSPFYGLFLLNLQKKIVDNDHPVKTAAVGPNGLNFTLYVNNTFWNTLSDKEQLSVLSHEVLHLCFFHVTNLFKADNHYNMNIACDAEVNQYISNLPANCVTLEKLSKTIGEVLEPKKGAWYYYKKIEKFAREHPEKCISDENSFGDFSDIDDHSLWPEGISDAERKLYENQLKQKLKETADIVQKQAGVIPGELTEILEKIKNNPPIFNWRKYFRRIVGNSISSEILLTRMKPNKRFPENKGTKFKLKPDICVVVDTSGSINKDNFNDFFSEINYIHKTGVNITVVECDTTITKIFKYKNNTNIEFKGRGGTNMTEALKYYKDNKKFSTCVLFTDGYLSTFDFPSCRNLIWVITKNGNKSQKYPGQTIFIP